MSKWIARAIALAATAAPGTALAHHGGPEDAAIGIGAAGVAMAVAAVFLGVRAYRRRSRA